jgi:superfamily I DNA/RNA helicase
MKSAVTEHTVADFQEMLGVLHKRLKLQLDSYGREFLGVLAPRRELAEGAFEMLRNTDVGGKVTLNGSYNLPFDAQHPIVVSTVHSAKGLEFRAAHLLCADLLTRRGAKNLAYTGVTRAKTSLDVYSTGPVEPFLNQALATVRPRPTAPSISDLLKGA